MVLRYFIMKKGMWSMTQLSERDLALLSALIYSEYVVEQKAGASLEDMVEILLERTKDGTLGGLTVHGDFGDIKKSQGEAAAAEEFREVLEAIQGSDALKGLTIQRPLANDGSKSGITAAAFVDASGAATVVFRGTDSYRPWFDNFQATDKAVTPMQKTAKEYIDGLEYDKITVTGHSKGGNLAAFVTIVCSKVFLSRKKCSKN